MLVTLTGSAPVALMDEPEQAEAAPESDEDEQAGATDEE